MSRIAARSWLGWMTVAVLMSIVAPSSAEPATDETAALVLVAEQAYRVGAYDFAIRAFERANGRSPAPALELAIANARYQRFQKRKKPYDRVQAIVHFRKYLAGTPAGEEADRARTKLAELEVSDTQLDADGLAAAAAEENQQTWLAVTSATLGATARLDDGKPHKLPWFTQVKPGKHVITVTAHEYEKRVTRVTVPRGYVYPLVAVLEPEPAKLSVDTTSDAAIYVDGVFVGVAPLEEPVAVEPGVRRIAVLHTGREMFEENVSLRRGHEHELEADLDVTGQRIAAGFLLGGGAAGLGAGIVFGVLSFIDHRAARDLRGGLGSGVDEEQQRLLDRRDDYRIGSGVAAGFGLALFAVGGALFILDDPVPPDGEAPRVTLAPRVSPVFAGTELSVSF